MTQLIHVYIQVLKYTNKLLIVLFICRMDGFCRQIVALLFEIVDYRDDSNAKSVTSGPCLWKRRPKKINTDGTLATDIDISVKGNPSANVPTPESYNPIPSVASMPNVEDYVTMVNKARPNACMLDTWRVKSTTKEQNGPELDIVTPTDKMFTFCLGHNSHTCTSVCSDEYMEYLKYSASDLAEVNKTQRDKPKIRIGTK